MENYPGMTNVLTSQGGVECVIGDPGARLPVTIDGARLGSASAKVTIDGPALYGRRTASPNKLVPFQSGGVISDPTNTTNATVDIPDADAVRFVVGDVVTFIDTSTGLLSSESLTLDIIGAAGSGGAGVTLLTFTAETWSTPPEAADILVVADGTELSVQAVLILEDIEFDGSTDVASSAFINGQFVSAAVKRRDYFIQSENQVLQMVAID
jgi:hypothetical protein